MGGGGLIAIANWHTLSEAEAEEEDGGLDTPGQPPNLKAVVESLFPITPGKSAGNSLDTLDQRFARGGVLDFLAGLPELLAFNDEAHHIHEFKREGEATELEWQKSLPTLNPLALPPFTGFTLAQLQDMLGRGDVMASTDVQTGTRFGDYRVDGGVMTATG